MTTRPPAPGRFYVAGKAAAAEDDVNAVAQALERIGWTRTLDWTGLGVTKPYAASPGVNGPAAAAMIDAAAGCDLLVLLWHPRAFGAIAEFGAAIGAGARVALLGWPDDARDSVFFAHHAVTRHPDTDDLLRHLTGS
ncbi:hypothetical protein DVS28_b0051 (plasmid) [Euzebya pacifica]|uniref:Nucleoside 2-deoxyribosyltransferase n=1 Tax=Euzebya pacifica TaxID=1608957 RepID=A0A346Y5S4_9ACTN|nr:hypothetical protein [Euzebya pacifica]AXV09821.1 hypothetical protein DVS28_b0051 [Euzebya pacifica]